MRVEREKRGTTGRIEATGGEYRMAGFAEM